MNQQEVEILVNKLFAKLELAKKDPNQINLPLLLAIVRRMYKFEKITKEIANYLVETNLDIKLHKAYIDIVSVNKFDRVLYKKLYKKIKIGHFTLLHRNTNYRP